MWRLNCTVPKPVDMEYHINLITWFIFFMTVLNLTKDINCDEDACKILEEKLLDECCNQPKKRDLTKENLDYMDECRSSALKPHGGKMPADKAERKRAYECYAECYYKVTKRLSADLKPNETAVIIDFNRRLLAKSSFKEKVPIAVKECTSIDFSLKVDKTARCKSGTKKFVECIMANLFLNCPDDQWHSEREECKNSKYVKDRFKKCYEDITS